MMGRDDLSNELNHLYLQLGRTPTLFDIDDYTDYQPADYMEEYRTFDNALVEADVLDCFPHAPTMGLVDDLYMIASTVGHTPRTIDVRESGEYSVATYQRRFGSWPDALVSARFEPIKGDSHSDAELKRKVRMLAAQFDQPPALSSVEIFTGVEPTVYTRRFGPWDQFLAELELFDSDG